MSNEKPAEILSIDSPIHQLRAIEEVILDTGSAVLYPVGIEELASELAGCTKEEIMEMLGSMTMLPQLMMNDRVEGGPPIVALFAFVDQSLANLLDSVQKDKTETEQEED